MSNRWDERYRRGELTVKAPEPLLEVAAAAVPTGHALDVACGAGRHTLWLARRAWSVTAVDYSQIALTLLQQNAAGLDIRTVRADLEQDEFEIEPGRYDLIVDTCFLYRPLFPALREGVRPGGVFFGVFPLEDNSAAASPFNPAFLMKPGELTGFFTGWDILHYVEKRPAPERRLRAETIARRPLSAE